MGDMRGGGAQHEEAADAGVEESLAPTDSD